MKVLPAFERELDDEFNPSTTQLDFKISQTVEDQIDFKIEWNDPIEISPDGSQQDELVIFLHVSAEQ